MKTMKALMVAVMAIAGNAMAGTINLSLTGTGTGTVDVRIGTTTTTYSQAAVITVTDGVQVFIHATPATGSGHRNWFINGTKQWGDRTITAAGNVTVQAVFDLQYTCTITNTVQGTAGGNVNFTTGTPQYNIAAGQSLTLKLWKNQWYRMTPQPCDGYYASYTKNGAGPYYNGPNSGTITANITFVVTFKLATPRSLALSWIGNGTGSIELTVGGVKTVYSQTMTLTINEGTTVNFHGAPASGSALHYVFVNGAKNWGDQVFVITGNSTLQTQFDLWYTIAVNTTIEGGGGGNVHVSLGTPQYDVPAGQQWSIAVWKGQWYRVTPQPSAGSTVTMYINGAGPYYGACSGNANSNVIVTATFVGSGTTLAVTISPPSGTFVAEGSDATLSAIATGGASPYTYQWCHYGRVIATGTTMQFTATSANESHEGLYSVDITDHGGTKASSQAVWLLVQGLTARVKATYAGNKALVSYNPNGLVGTALFWSGAAIPEWNDPAIKLIAEVDGMATAVKKTVNGPFEQDLPKQFEISLAGQPLRDCALWFKLGDASGGEFPEMHTYWYNNQSMTAVPGGHPMNLITGPALPAWSISSQTGNKQTRIGDDVVFSIQASLEVKHQWYFKRAGTTTEAALSGQIYNYLVVENVQTANLGTYRCVATDVAGHSVSSANMALS